VATPEYQFLKKSWEFCEMPFGAPDQVGSLDKIQSHKAKPKLPPPFTPPPQNTVAAFFYIKNRFAK
jgi:hypothetical protein